MLDVISSCIEQIYDKKGEEIFEAKEFRSVEEVLDFIEQEYDPWITPTLEEYMSNVEGVDVQDLNRFLRTEQLVMENEYEQWIEDTYHTPG